MVLLILIVVSIAWTILHIAPGDPALLMAGEQATLDQIEKLRHLYGLDKPLHEQYIIYISKFVQGDLGYSLKFQRPVLEVIFERVPATLLLVLTSQLIGLVFGTISGVFCARRHRSKPDTLMSIVSLATYSIPIFWLGLMFILVFAVLLPIFPTSGMLTPGLSTSAGPEYILNVLWHLFLPASTLVVVWIWPQFLRLTRTSVIEVMKEDFVNAARAKGLSERNVFYRHVLRNALLPTVTISGIQIGLVMTGAVLTETVFAWPGLGRLMVESVFWRDYPLCMAIFLVASISVLIATFLIDIIYALLDPRIRLR